MKIVLCGQTFPPSRDTLAPLLPEDEVIVVPAAQVSEAAASADVLIPMMARLDVVLIRRTSARLIQQWGAGLEGVDIDAASARGIYVCNVPSDETPNAESTAEHAVLLMLACARRLHTCFRAFDKGLWGAPLGDALFGRRALILGFGRIGRALARRLVALGMEVDAIRRRPERDEAAQTGVREVGTPSDLLRMAADADFLVCTATATEEARGMINASTLHVMKPTSIVVNVSRGAVINEPALIAALKSGLIAGAGLDVFAQEPVDLRSPLLRMENVIATPHVAGVTTQSYEGIARAIAANVTAVKEGRMPKYCVNPAARPA